MTTIRPHGASGAADPDDDDPWTRDWRTVALEDLRDLLISSGQYTCEHNFCAECNQNEYCDKTCGFCESAADEIVDCDAQFDPSCAEVTADCQNDEAARAVRRVRAVEADEEQATEPVVSRLADSSHKQLISEAAH